MINAGTPIEEIDLDSANEKTRRYNFTQFSDLHLHTESNSTVDIIALAVRISSPRQMKNLYGKTAVQDLLLLTHEMKPITLTIWDQFVSQEGCTIANIIDSLPVLLATRLKVATYEDALCLSTKSTSFFMINPDIPVATPLRSWCRFQVELRDATGSLQATYLRPNAENLFPITASNLKSKTNENGITEENYLSSISPTQSQLLLLKPYDNSRGVNKNQRSLTITEIRNDDKNNSSIESSK